MPWACSRCGFEYSRPPTGCIVCGNTRFHHTPNRVEDNLDE